MSEKEKDSKSAWQTAQVGQLLIKEEVPVKAYILSVLHSPEAADEVFQQVAVIALEKADDFELGTNFRTWAMSIGRFACLEYIRKRSGKAFAASELIDMLAEESGASQEDPHQLMAALHECLEQVPTDSRRVLFLRYVEGKPVDKIANFISRTLQGTYAFIKRLKAKIRECVERKTGFSVVPFEEGAL
ncbi:MAG: sigma-70 family RNA polymerase sigma factor [Planctomycetes bacterium]|nr:sigma-70 family RNA polymerase sigma factor [Planctomycetota bacterium]